MRQLIAFKLVETQHGLQAPDSDQPDQAVLNIFTQKVFRFVEGLTHFSPAFLGEEIDALFLELPKMVRIGFLAHIEAPPEMLRGPRDSMAALRLNDYNVVFLKRTYREYEGTFVSGSPDAINDLCVKLRALSQQGSSAS
jgi:hypothetical protein